MTHAAYPTHEDLLRNKIMDAAIVCIQAKGVDKTRIGDIAKELGIARQTIYNYFSSKNQLFDDIFSREAVFLAQAIARHIEQFDTVEDKFTHAFLHAIEAFPQNPILAHIITTGGQYLQEIGHSRDQMQAFGELALHRVFEDNPHLKKDAEEICEFLSRNIISFLVMADQPPRTPEQLAGYVKRRLLPGIGL